MILRMAWGKVRFGTWDQYEKLYKSDVEPTVNSVKGLAVRELLRSTEDPDEGISITLWETEEDLKNYEASELQQSLSKVAEHLYRGEYWIKTFVFDYDKLVPGPRRNAVD